MKHPRRAVRDARRPMLLRATPQQLPKVLKTDQDEREGLNLQWKEKRRRSEMHGAESQREIIPHLLLLFHLGVLS